MNEMFSLLREGYEFRGLVLEDVPEVSTIVVVRLLLSSGGMVITGTTVWILDTNESLTKEVISLRH